MKQREKISNKKYNGILAFSLPIVILLTVYAYLEIFPFGKYTILTWDLSGQYMQFLSYFQDCLMGKASFAYSMAGGIGQGTIGLFAYYLSSPFNLVTLFFSKQNLYIAVTLIVLLKTGCMAFTMYLYLRREGDSVLAVFFSSCYALSSYVITYQSNIMWLDALIWLPVMVAGLDKLIEQGKKQQYTLALALILISNYYIGYMVCVFSVIYFVSSMICEKCRRISWRRLGKTVLDYGLSSLLAGGLSAWLLIPAFLSMQGSSNKSSAGYEVLFNNAKLYLYRQLSPLLLAGTYDDSHRYNISGKPLLYCGVIVIIALFAFLLCRRIQTGRKCKMLLLLVILIYSMNHMGTFLAWHGFYAPIGAPWRFAFLWTFVVIVMAYEGIEKGERGSLIGAGALFILYAGFIGWKFPAYRQLLAVSLIFVGLQLLFWGLYKVPHSNENARCILWGRRLSIICFAFLICTELGYNAIKVWTQGFSWVEVENYVQDTEKVEQFTQMIHETEGLDGKYTRVEIGTGSNQGFMHDVNCISMYASTENDAMWNLQGMMGFLHPDFQSNYRTGSTMLADDILGIKYFYEMKSNKPGIVEKGVGDVSYMENEDALPVAYLVDKSADQITVENYQECMAYDYTYEVGEKNLFSIQNDLYHALIGDENEDAYTVLRKDDVPRDVLDVPPGEYYSRGRINYLMSIGDTGYYTDTISYYTENQDAVQEAVNATGSRTVEITNDSDTDIRGTFDNHNGEAAYVCFAIPYEAGWSAAVDGVKAEIVKGMGGLILVPVDQGEHEVRIRYHTPGFMLGIAVSLLCCIGCVCRKYKSQNEGTGKRNWK